jgi:flagellar protein FliO/FliZ
MNANQLGWTDALQMLLSFGFVVVLLLVLLHFLKKMQQGQGFGRSARRMHVVETLGLGARQKVLITRVDDREFLLGVTATDISVLGQWAADDRPSDLVAPMATSNPKKT